MLIYAHTLIPMNPITPMSTSKMIRPIVLEIGGIAIDDVLLSSDRIVPLNPGVNSEKCELSC